MLDEKTIGERLTRIEGIVREVAPNFLIGPRLRINSEGKIGFSAGIFTEKTPDYLEVRGQFDTFAEALEAAEAHLAAIPTQEERDLSTFHVMVAEALDFGRDANIDAAFINPLSDISKKLASNAITKVKK